MSIWDFAVAFHTQDKVAPACLILQDSYGVDVDVLIYAAWIGITRQVPLSGAAIAISDSHIATWRTEIVQPLRAIRQRLKIGPAPAPTPDTEALRDKVKSSELQSEALLLAELERQAPPIPANTASAEILADLARQNMRAAIEFYHQAPLDQAAEDRLDDLCAGLSFALPSSA